MADFTTSKHFTKYTNPDSGVVSYILTTRVAALQQCFYFVNSGMSDDGRYLWIYCSNPPKSGHHLALIDFETDEITDFPDTNGSGWFVDHNGDVYWGCADGIMMRSPDKKGARRALHRHASHLHARPARDRRRHPAAHARQNVRRQHHRHLLRR